ncbi:MAG: hypothetical protein KC445_13090 [Anaerolineales bacterium]|nr:hypothetical protein [Anaerolineales bacterium]
MENYLAIQYAPDFEVLRAAIGRTVAELARDQYYFNNEPSGTDNGSLEVRLDDGNVITLRLAGDGQSVRADAQPLKITPPFSLSENAHCSWRRVELTALSDFASLRGQKLNAIEAIIEIWKDQNSSGYINGWVLHFEAGDFVCYFNYGDEARILLNELPTPEYPVDVQMETIAAIEDAA